MNKVINDRGGKFFIENSSLGLLKWIALILMTGDHINTYLLEGSNSVLYSLGRIVMPIFIFVLVYNLTRPGVYEKGRYLSIINRLLFFGFISIPAIFLLGGGGINHIKGGSGHIYFNILFTLALLVWCLYAFEKGEKNNNWKLLGWFSFFVLGFFVEYFWAALGLGLSFWWYYKDKPMDRVLVLSAFSLVILWILSLKSYGFLLFIPLVYLASKIKIDLPRMKWFFYSYYPLHLSLIYVYQIFVGRGL